MVQRDSNVREVIVKTLIESDSFKTVTNIILLNILKYNYIIKLGN